MLGTALKTVNGYWTKPTSITDVKPEEIHGHIFIITPNGKMQAYEYRDGTITSLDGVDPAFFRELVEYLHVNNLTNVLGRVLAKEAPEMMCEFDLKDNSTVTLDEGHVKKWMSHRVTGFALSGPGMTELKGGQSHAKPTKGTHQVFVDGKIGNEESLIHVLQAEEIVY